MITKYQDKERYIKYIDTDKRWKEILFLTIEEIGNENNKIKVLPKQLKLSAEDIREILDIHIL